MSSPFARMSPRALLAGLFALISAGAFAQSEPTLGAIADPEPQAEVASPAAASATPATESAAPPEAVAPETAPAVAAPQVTTEGSSTEPSAEKQGLRQEKETQSTSAADKERENRAGIAVAARLSTLGFGVELIKSINKRVNLRAQGNFFDINQDIDEDDINYDAKLKLKTFGLLADFHPFAGSFRITAGGYSNGNKVGLKATCKTECEVGDLTISDDPNSADDARLFGGIKFKSFAPYVGLGFGNAMRGWPVHFGVDVGVLLQGSPKINLGAAGSARVTDENGNTTTENLSTNADVQAALREEEANAEDDSKEFKYYPVINFTLGYRFHL